MKPSAVRLPSLVGRANTVNVNESVEVSVRASHPMHPNAPPLSCVTAIDFTDNAAALTLLTFTLRDVTEPMVSAPKSIAVGSIAISTSVRRVASPGRHASSSVTAATMPRAALIRSVDFQKYPFES